MSKYVDLPWNKKLALLNAHDISGPWKKLDQTRWCLHCSKQFDGHAVRVWQDLDGSLWLECGTPGCNGSPIDWAPYPWWDENYPAQDAPAAKDDHPGNPPARNDDAESDEEADSSQDKFPDIPF